MKFPRLRAKHLDNRIPMRFPGESNEAFRNRVIKTGWLTPSDMAQVRMYEESEWGKPVRDFSGHEIKQMGRREFLRYAGTIGTVAGLVGLGVGERLGIERAHALSATTIGGKAEPGSMEAAAAWIIYQDSGTIFARNGAVGSNDKSDPSDFGAVFNYCVGQLPQVSGFPATDPSPGAGGGLILVKASSSPYKYSTQPIINVSFARARGEGVGTRLQPSASVDGLSIVPPGGASPANYLTGCEISDFQFQDPNELALGKALLKIDCNLNTGFLTNGLFTRLFFNGRASSTGKTPKGILATGSASGYPWYCNFRDISYYQKWSDSQIDVGWHTDLHLEMFSISLYISSNYTVANPVWKFSSPADNATGSRLRWWIVANGTVFLASMIALYVNNQNSLHLLDVFLDLATTPAPLYTVFKLDGTSPGALSAVDCDFVGGAGSSVGLEFGATASSFAETFGDGSIFDNCKFRLCNVGLQSDSGDTSKKTFIGGGSYGNTTVMSPNPLTNAKFFLFRIAGVTSQGWQITTPALPAGIGLANAVQNNTGFTVMVNAAGFAGCHIIDETGTDILLPSDTTTVILPPLCKVYYATTIPTSWKWFAIF